MCQSVQSFLAPQQREAVARKRGAAHIGWRHREAIVILQQVYPPVSKLLRILILVPQAARVLGARLEA